MAKPNIENNLEEQLILLRDLTKRMSVLHDAQRLQLQMWPIVLFQEAKNVQSELSMDKREITFLVQQPGKATKDFKTSCATLNDWVKWLLGDEWIVKVKLRDKQVYRDGARLTK